MTESNALGQTKSWRLAHALLAACRGQVRDAPRPMQLGIKFLMRRGGYLVVWFRIGGVVSRLS